jgi:hypothetical protein
VKALLQSLPLVGKAFQDVTPAEVKAFWRFMQDHFGTSVINKGNAVEMQLVATALSTIGVQSRDTFLKRFTTTIGDRIYMPFEVGKPGNGHDLWNQIVVCVHEHQHVIQHEREGLLYEASYITDRAARAKWEAEAFTCNVEVHFWRYGKIPSTRELAERLNSYGCRAADVDVTAQSLALAAASVRRGAVVNESSRIAIGWLNKHLGRLRK